MIYSFILHFFIRHGFHPQSKDKSMALGLEVLDNRVDSFDFPIQTYVKRDPREGPFWPLCLNLNKLGSGDV